MAVWTDQPLGNEGNLDRVDLDWAIDQIIEPYGLGDRRYWRTSTLTVGTEQQICAIGLEADAGGLGNSGDITEVSVTYNEQTTEPNMLAVSPGVDVETGTRLMYMGTGCFIFTGTEHQYTIAGQGVPPIPQTAQNDFLTSYVTKAFAAAHGTGVTITVDALAQITDWRQSKPKDAFWTWGVDAECIVENPSPGSSNILSPPSEVTDLVPSDMLGPYSQTITMTKGKDNRATSSWSLTLYHTT